ncbi:MAG: hypothetical protein A2Z65_10760 [Gallionellales bacterium RIFCSPLOWO2_02_58_13]|nr:MAG: hypothetical protein A2Z65_10760 [Gallionellales bacterium RIFCSPLOWO2_02_58_13]
MITLFARGITICMLLFPFGVASALEPGEGIFLDQTTGNYTLIYTDDELENGNKVLARATFFPATKIDPAIYTKLRLDGTGAVNYSYSVSSGAQSRQLLRTVRFDLFNKVVGSQDLPTNTQSATLEQVAAVFEANKLALTTPANWEGFISTNKNGASRISWNRIESDAGIRPGETQQEFGFVSQSLTGLGMVQFKGLRDGRNGFSGEGPISGSDIDKQIQALYQNDFVARNAAVPTIAIPDPFDPAVTLERIQEHMHTWIAKQLIEPAFAAQLDSHFKTAADVYRKQGSAGNGQVGKMLALLVQQYEGLEKGDEELVKKKSAVPAQLDKLAALVLYFDLKYVMRRMGGGN